MLTTLVVAAVLLVSLLLVTPVDFDVRLERRPVFRYRFGVRWLYGLLGKDLGPPTVRKEPPAPEDKPAKKKPRRKKAKGFPHVVAMLRSRGFVRGAVRLVQRLIQALRVREFSLWLRAGFDDPASTGVTCGMLLPIVAYFEAHYPDAVDVAPDFSRETLEFAFASQVRITPFYFLWPVVTFGLSPSTLRGLIALRTGRVA